MTWTPLVSFIIPGKAVGKERRIGSGRFARTPPKTRAYELDVGWLAKAAMVGCIDAGRVSQAPCRAKIVVQKTGKQLAGSIATGTPDLDNVAKAILDGMNGIIWYDDRQVAELIVKRQWGAEEQVSVSVEEWT